MEKIDGKLLSSLIKDQVKSCADSYHQTPILAVITIGDDEASKVYVENKRKACEYCGISMMHFDYADVVKENVVIKKIKELNKDKSVNGIILQLPIPDKFDTLKILNTISPLKDVDGLTDISQGKIMAGDSTFIPCTPKGILRIFDYYKIDLDSNHVVIVGRSNLVSKPIMMECVSRNATVTLCHSKTKDLKSFTKQADDLIVAVGKKHLIDSSFVKDGAVVIDVGITRIDGKIYGDVSPDVYEKTSYYTPVPGGVGPMTVAMLLKNTMIAYELQNVEDESDRIIK